jgi:hypothetical protein
MKGIRNHDSWRIRLTEFVNVGLFLWLALVVVQLMIECHTGKFGGI